MSATSFADLTVLAKHLRQELQTKKFILLYAYNGTGKTRLSTAFKDLGKKLVTSPLANQASESVAVARVAERVRQGGRHIPADVIRRRFSAGLRHFKGYKSAVNAWATNDNVGESPILLEWGENV